MSVGAELRLAYLLIDLFDQDHQSASFDEFFFSIGKQAAKFSLSVGVGIPNQSGLPH